MNQSRLTEIERRLAATEAAAKSIAMKASQVSDAISMLQVGLPPSSQTAPPAGGDVFRWSTQFKMWVEWDVRPTVRNSVNPTVDVPALMEALDDLETGYWMKSDHGVSLPTTLAWNPLSPQGLWATVVRNYTNSEFDLPDGPNVRHFGANVCPAFFYATGKYGLNWIPVIWPSGSFLESYAPGWMIWPDDLYDICSIATIWIPRDVIGQPLPGDPVVCHISGQGDAGQYSEGPKYGTTGTWEVPMICPQTSHHTTGSGTLFLQWGDNLWETAGESLGYEPEVEMITDDSGAGFSIQDSGSPTYEIGDSGA